MQSDQQKVNPSRKCIKFVYPKFCVSDDNYGFKYFGNSLQNYLKIDENRSLLRVQNFRSKMITASILSNSMLPQKLNLVHFLAS